MGSKKDIGKAYKEQLESYSSSPHNRVWENIEAELKKSKRRVFPIWITLTGLGILLLISSFGVYSYYSKTNSLNNNIKINQTEQATINNNTESSINSNDTIGDLNTINDENKEHEKNASLVDINSSDLSNTEGNDDTRKANSENNSILKQQNSTLNKKSNQNRNTKRFVYQNANTSNSNKNKNANKDKTYDSINTTNDDAINKLNFRDRYSNNLDLLNTTKDSIVLETYPVVIFDIDGLTKLNAEKKKKQKKKNEKKQNHPVAFSAYVSPTYTNMLGNGSSIDGLLDNNKISGRFNVNYGVAAIVKISKKSSIRLGIGSSQLSYTIKGADTTSTSFFDEETQNEIVGGYLMNSSGYDNLTISSQAFNSTPELFGENTVIDFEQKIKYLEIPIDYIYHLKDDTKLKINLIGGFSTLFLTDQSIIAKDRNGNSIKIGEAENLKKTNFSFNLGGHLSYSLSKKLSLQLEPRFKYYSSTFDNNVNTKPYSLGLRFGITYRF